MNWRLRLLLLATAVGVVLPYLLPPLTRLEWKSYDQRLAQVREIRGNLAPSLKIRMLGRDERTLRARPNWNQASTVAAIAKVAKSDPALIWVDPNLGLPAQPKTTQAAPLPSRTEVDGVVRSIDLADGQKLSPALELFAALMKVPPAKVLVNESSVTVGEHQFPRYLHISYPKNDLGGQSTESSSDEAYLQPNPIWLLDDPDASAVLADTLPGTAVLVSDDDVQARFVVSTPVGPLQPNQVEFAALDTMLSGWVLQKLPGPAQVGLVALCVLSVALLTFFVQSSVMALLSWASLAFVYTYICQQAFAAGWWLPEVPVIAGSLVSAVIVAVAQRLRAVRLMSRLLGSERAALAAQGEIALGGAERPVTIVFTNLPEQVKALEESDPEGSIRARNHYNALTTEVVRRYGGWMLDYQGDAQMAGFNVEKLDPQHALNAVKASLDLHRLLSEQYPQESIHCGVCSGPAAVGLVGAPGAKALAAIGDTTNVAARLMGAAMKQKVGVLIAKTVYDYCADDLQVNELAPVALKGKTTNVQVFAVEAVR